MRLRCSADLGFSPMGRRWCKVEGGLAMGIDIDQNINFNININKHFSRLITAVADPPLACQLKERMPYAR